MNFTDFSTTVYPFLEIQPFHKVYYKALEAFAAAADGKATKIIIPSEIQSLAGLATSFKEVISE